MDQYNFKMITVVPSGQALLDTIYSKIQLQTPTVKYIRTDFHKILSAIIDEFPRLDQIHPFYGDLLHVLYHKDHYKLALDQVKTARNLISKTAQEYLKRFKGDDSLQRRKCLKVAALGRMCTVVKRITPSLAYLEQIRQHMASLPFIDPNTLTVLICGYPKVDKSSFMNKVIRADVDVQRYAFTTNSLSVGHTDYKDLQYQVIEIIGILDRPFKDCSFMEMYSITALTHLRAAVLFFLDISGSCGYTIAQQAALFHSIKSLFTKKPLIIVCNITDLMPMKNLSEEDRKLVEEMKTEAMKTARGASEESVLLKISAMSDKGVMFVKNAACESLLKWKDDFMPDLHEVADVIDPDILEKLGELEIKGELGQAEAEDEDIEMDRCAVFIDWQKLDDQADDINWQEWLSDEKLRQAETGEHELEMVSEELTEEQKEELTEEQKEELTVAQNRSTVPRKFDKERKYTTKRMGRKRDRSGGNDDQQTYKKRRVKSRSRSKPRSRSQSRPPAHEVVPGDGFKDPTQKKAALSISHKLHKKRDKNARRGEADRVILRPKQLFSGKRGKGKTDRR